jgi:hypothetical protein
MKRSMSYSLTIVTITLSAFSFAACGSKSEQQEVTTESTLTEETNVEEASHVCPMHPDITGKEGDKCSKCGMPLEAVAAAEDSTHD